MSKYLVIVESPAKAKTIVKYLGRNYKVMASMGHLRDLPQKSFGVDIEKGFIPKYQEIKGKNELIKSLKAEAKNSEKVYLATDPDREGEAISWHIANMLNIDGKESCRITFNEITKSAVTSAIREPRVVDIDLVNAQQARRVLDRIVGYKLSPLLWKKIKKGLSAGRVQSVATKMICDREQEIRDFNPEEYWTITALVKTGKDEEFNIKLALFKGEKLTVDNERQAMDITAVLKSADYAVKSVKQTKKSRNPYPPFITSTLQQEASRKLGFTSKRTMIAAQGLYEGIEVKGRGHIGLITYMRTDSLRISTEALEEAKSYIIDRFGGAYAPKSYNLYKSKKSNVQDAHEAIRPTVIPLTPAEAKESLNNDQYKIYRLIWERFIASQMTKALFDVTSVDIEAEDYTLKASGSVILFDGFTRLYDEGTDTDNKNGDEEQKLPPLVAGDALSLLEVDPKQSFTKPPARYTEASLIKTMEEYGIGRPSTYAPTISTILQREYVVKDGKSLAPTDLGMLITEFLKKNFQDIVDVQFTANMEEQLDKIEDGELDWNRVLDDFYKDFASELDKAQDAERIKIEDEVTDELCDKCGRNMVIKDGRFGKFLACPGYPECKNAKPIVVEISDVVCPLCGGKIYQRKSKKGAKYYGCEKNPACSFMTWDEPTNERCELCQGVIVKKLYGKTEKKYCSNKDCENTLKYFKKGDKSKKDSKTKEKSSK